MKLLEYEENPLPMSWIIRALVEQGNYSEVNKWIQSLIKFEADPELATFPLYILAHIDLRQGNCKGAREKLLKALQISKQIVDKEGKSKTEIVLLLALAQIDFNQINYDEAGNSYSKALEICRGINDRIKEGPILTGLACVDFKKGNYAQAKANFMKALDICCTLDSRPEEAEIFYKLGAMTAERGQIEEGLRLVALACMIFKSVGHVMFNEANACFNNLMRKNRYDMNKIDLLIAEVLEIYGRDHGVDLIEAAFHKV